MKKLDVYLADLAIGNIKLHNLHWNVKGMAFKQVHEYLETLYDDAFEKFDEVAELQKLQGTFPNACVKDYLAISQIKELESKSYSISEALQYASEYLKTMKQTAEEIRKEADKEDNFIVSNAMQSHIELYSKHLWFLESMVD